MATGNEKPGRDAASAFEEVKQRTASGIEDLEGAARERAEAIGQDMGHRAEAVAEAVRAAGESLRGKEDWLADAAESVGRSLERLSAAAREKGIDGIRRDVEQLARERPVVFMGSALAIGLALGRVLRSRPQTERTAEDWHRQGREATQGAAEQLGPGAGWPSAPEAAARPTDGGPRDAGGYR
jgi:hypothetical protein